MDINELGCEGMGWIQVVEDKGQWRTHVNTVVNVRVP